MENAREEAGERRPWLDRPDARAEIARRAAAGELTQEQTDAVTHFHDRGFLALENMLDHGLADELVRDIKAVGRRTEGMPIAQRKLEFENIFTHSDATRRATCNPKMLAWLDLLLGMRALPYQTLSLPVSSQIGAHSDAILMTSRPPNHLIAIWYALEDITPTCGPVYGIPGSHRWPYVSASATGIPRGSSAEECTQVYDSHYYPAIERLVEEHGVKPYTFLGKKGDALIWHSNLIHGTMPVLRGEDTRMCLIVHYYGEHCEPYSDLFDRPCELPGLR